MVHPQHVVNDRQSDTFLEVSAIPRVQGTDRDGPEVASYRPYRDVEIQRFRFITRMPAPKPVHRINISMTVVAGLARRIKRHDADRSFGIGEPLLTPQRRVVPSTSFFEAFLVFREVVDEGPIQDIPQRRALVLTGLRGMHHPLVHRQVFHGIIKRVDRPPHVVRSPMTHHVIRRGLHVRVPAPHAIRRHGVVDDLQPRREERGGVGRAGRADLAGVQAVEAVVGYCRLFGCGNVVYEPRFARVGAVVLLQWNAFFSVVALAEPGLGF
mmetsp:Transcript_24514/g.68981  ORF Transcript_24514/g.68981 Transcript_24514/m.68981 type:complete len:268 (+) Transcript_24514:627-1430(+)